jgi:hypothetical protein
MPCSIYDTIRRLLLATRAAHAEALKEQVAKAKGAKIQRVNCEAQPDYLSYKD